MALTTDSLFNSVNLELQNHDQRGSASAVGNGIDNAFIVAPLGGYVTDDAVWGVWVNGVENTSDTMDYDTGIFTFASPPDDGDEILFTFNFKSYNDKVVDQAILTAIDALFPWFYSEAIDDTITEADFEDNELEIEDCEAVIGFMLNSGSSWARTPRKNFEMYKAGGSAFIRFFSGAPTADKMRIHYVTRPLIADLPDRAAYPIISYACYYLLQQKTAARTRGDVAIVTQGTGTLSPRQMNDAGNAFLLRFQMQCQTMRQKPWSVF
jgi:hypothetical protein